MAAAHSASFGCPSLSQGDTGPNEISFGLAQVIASLGQQALRFGQRRAPQQAPLILLAGLPLAQGRPQPLLPDPEGPVSPHPVPQPAPSPNQGFVDDLYRLLPSPVLAGADPPGIGQPLGQRPGPGPLRLARARGPIDAGSVSRRG